MRISVLESYSKAIKDQVLQEIEKKEEENFSPDSILSFSEYGSSTPIHPEAEAWEIFPNPERYYREYEFDSFENISRFIEACFEAQKEISQTVYINYRIQRIGRVGIASVEVGEGVLTEEERITTQIFDEIYELVLDPEGEKEAGFPVYLDDEDEYDLY